MIAKHNNISDLHTDVFEILNNKNINQAFSEAKIIIYESALKKNYSLVSEIDYRKLTFIINKRLEGKPLSKIIKKKGFWKDIFYTNEFTLDPRADSEILVETIVKDFSNKNYNFKFIDLCSGTGCLGISLLREFPKSDCLFIDVSSEATNVNNVNCQKLNLSSRSEILISNLFDNFVGNINDFKFIVCNPPYLSSLDLVYLNKETSYDPIIALDGGEDGCDFYQIIFIHLIKVGYKNSIYLEIDPKIKEKVTKLALENNLKLIYTKDDYLNQSRLIKISFQ